MHRPHPLEHGLYAPNLYIRAIVVIETFSVFHNNLTITVRSPGLPGQRFMMLEYRVPVSGISDAVDYPRTSASHTENCPTQRILSERVISWLSKHLNMLDFRVVYDEKTNYFEFSVTAIAKFAPAITT